MLSIYYIYNMGYPGQEWFPDIELQEIGNESIAKIIDLMWQDDYDIISDLIIWREEEFLWLINFNPLFFFIALYIFFL